MTLVLLAACSFDPGAPPGVGDGCFDAAGAQICAEPSARQLAITSDHDVDTDGDHDCASRTAPYCVISAQSIAITATLRAHGKRPLVLVATDDISITGVIDVAGRTEGAPNANIGCGAGSVPVINGGGYGGGRGTAGAAGGYGNASQANGGGVPAAIVIDERFAGGCDGNAGAGGMAGTGGRGGGVVAVLSSTAIVIDGAIRASGGGGGGAAKHAGGSGGGGGGSGGMIVLRAPAIDGAGTLEANGGGGGAGSEGNTAGGNGAVSTAFELGGAGGTGTGKSNDGGAGAGQAIAPGAGANAVMGAGGGGGGGGVGVIDLAGATFAKSSPLPH